MKIKAGLILPGSSVVPSMGKDFKKGFELALLQNNLSSVEIVSGFVNHGGLEDVQKASEKLIQYDDVDLISGIISNPVSMQLIEFFKNNKIPLLLNNLGENILIENTLPDFYHFNSMHLWESEWALGYWAQKEYGGDLSISMTVYDAGYHLHEAFRLGAEAAGAQNTHYNILKIQPGIVNTKALIEHISEQKPSHVHALLCGMDAADFWKRFKNAGFLGKIPLTVSPFFFDGIDKVDNHELVSEIYSASSWEHGLEASKSKFSQEFNQVYDLNPSAFSLLGYESGLLLAEAIANANSKKDLKDQLNVATIRSPRGETSNNYNSAVSGSEIWLNNHQFNASNTSDQKFLQLLKVPELQNQKIQNIAVQSLTGWQNPYLCI